MIFVFIFTFIRFEQSYSSNHSINFEPSSIFLYPIWLLATVATLFPRQTSHLFRKHEKGIVANVKRKKICIHKNVCNKMVKWNRRTPLYVNTFQRIDNTCSWLYRCHCCCYSSFKAFVLIKLLLRIAKKQLNIATFQRALAVFRSFAFDFFTIYRYRSSIQ